MDLIFSFLIVYGVVIGVGIGIYYLFKCVDE